MVSGTVHNVPRNTYVAGIQNGYIHNAISNTVIKRAKNVASLLLSPYLTYYVVYIQQNFQKYVGLLLTKCMTSSIYIVCKHNLLIRDTKHK